MLEDGEAYSNYDREDGMGLIKRENERKLAFVGVQDFVFCAVLLLDIPSLKNLYNNTCYAFN